MRAITDPKCQGQASSPEEWPLELGSWYRVGGPQLERKQKGSYIPEGGGVGAGFILRN